MRGWRYEEMLLLKLLAPKTGLVRVLTKDELITPGQPEVQVLLHLAWKVGPTKLAYRPAAKQRGMLELLQNIAIMGPIHLRGIEVGLFDLDACWNTWRAEEAPARAMNREEVQGAIGKQSALFVDLLGSSSDADLRAEIEMFGHKASRGLLIIGLVLCHYAACRMQLFPYLKARRREELNTMNLWAGIDAAA